jgi:competence ComEA-like helix-hairpin-helix protein
MDSAASTSESGPPAAPLAPPPPPAPPALREPETFPLMTWPKTVQISLSLLVTAGVFFLVGRWSLDWSRPQPVSTITLDHGGPSLDLNRATKSELRLLPGMGDALSQRVVDHRARHGPFRSVDDLGQVKGFGPKTLDRLRPWFFVTHEERPLREEASDMVSTGKSPAMPGAPSGSSKKAAKLGELIDVNHATQAELQKLPGIGPKMSQRILDERAKKFFKSVEDLRRVSGIGPKVLEKRRPYVVIEQARPIAAAAAAD